MKNLIRGIEMVKKESYKGNWIFKFKDNNKIAFEVTFEKYLRDSYLEAKIDWYSTQINNKDQYNYTLKSYP